MTENDLSLFHDSCDLETLENPSGLITPDIRLWLRSKLSNLYDIEVPPPVQLRNSQSDVSTTETMGSLDKCSPSTFANK